jgi:hypothetical protein
MKLMSRSELIYPIMIDVDHGRAKSSMIIPAELQFFLKNLINKIINLEHIPMKPIAFCMR